MLKKRQQSRYFEGGYFLSIIVWVTKAISFLSAPQTSASAVAYPDRARRQRVTVSEYLRRRASISLAPAPPKPAKVRCPYTGAMIFASPDDQPPLTTDAVRELLSDFP